MRRSMLTSMSLSSRLILHGHMNNNACHLGPIWRRTPPHSVWRWCWGLYVEVGSICGGDIWAYMWRWCWGLCVEVVLGSMCGGGVVAYMWRWCWGLCVEVGSMCGGGVGVYVWRWCWGLCVEVVLLPIANYRPGLF